MYFYFSIWIYSKYFFSIYCFICIIYKMYIIPKFINKICQEKEAKTQYSCCERKIFPFLKQNSIRLVIYCKYEPCCLCIPAIRREKIAYKQLKFYAFAKNFKQVKKMINNHKKLVLQDYTNTLFS